MKRNILIHPDPRLKKVCAPVADITDDLRKLADGQKVLGMKIVRDRRVLLRVIR